MPLPVISAIYTITNLYNNKVYVGYAKDVDGRFASHRKELRKGKHRNPYLQKSWNFYGESIFKFEILLECPVEYLPSEENYWCNLLDTHNRKYGYNIQYTSPTNKPSMNPLIKEKLRNINLGKIVTEETRLKLSISGKLKYKIDKSTRDHIKYMFELSSKSIKGGWKRTSSVSKNEHDCRSKSAKLQNGIQLNTPESINKRILSIRKPVMQFDLLGNFIREWDYVGRASQELSISDKRIYECVGNKRDNYGGFVWKYKSMCNLLTEV